MMRRHSREVGTGVEPPPLAARVAIVVVASAAVWWVVSGLRHVLVGPGYDRAGHVLGAVLTTALIVPLVWVARRHLDRRGWDGMGLPSLATHWPSALTGIAAYAVPAALLLALVAATGQAAWSLEAPATELVATVAGLAVLVLLFEALPEELAFRGYLYRNLLTTLPHRSTVLVQAGLFTAWGYAIGAGGGLDRLLMLLGVGIVLGVLRAVTGGLWTPIGFHVAFQTFQQLFSPTWEQVTVTAGAAVLEVLVLGIAPLLLGAAVIERLPGRSVDWEAREPDPG